MNRKTFKAVVRHFGSQTAVAKAAGVSRPAVSGWKKGDFSPSIDSCIAISKASGIPVSDLYPELRGML